MRGLICSGILMWVVWLACGNGPGPREPVPGAADAAAEPADALPEAPPPPPAPAEYEGDPGTLKVAATFMNEVVESTIEVRRQGETDVVAQATLGADHPEHEFSLPPGRYAVSASFPGSVDNAHDVRENQRIRSDRTLDIDFTFENISQVTLTCVSNRRSTSGTIRLRRIGADDWLTQVRCGQEFIISGGSYEAEVSVGRNTVIQIPQLQITGGGRVTSPIDIEMGGR